MANHKSSEKRARQAITKTARNTQAKKAVRTSEKKLRTAIANKETEAAQSLLVSYTSKIAKAAQKGMVHAKNASRKISRLSVQVNSISK